MLAKDKTTITENITSKNPSKKLSCIYFFSDPERRINQSHMAIGLRDITPLRPICTHIFTKYSQVIAKRQYLVQILYSILYPAYTSQCINIPISTYKESSFRHTKIIVMLIAIEETMFRQ